MSRWMIETDKEELRRIRMGAVNGRYQICHPDEGFIGAVDRRADAFEEGERYAIRKLPNGDPYCARPYQVEIYDRMARRGRPRIWRLQRRLPESVLEQGDVASGNSDVFWKAIRWA